MGAVSLGYGPDGKRIRRKVSGKTKQEVRDKLRALHQEMESGVRSSRTYTVRETVEDWLRDGLDGTSERTRTLYEGLLEPVLEMIGPRPLRELSAGDVRLALSELVTRYSTRSLQITRNCLERAIRHAESNDLIGRNVAALVKPPRGRNGRPSKSFTLDQAKALLAAAQSTRWQAYVAAKPARRHPYRGGPCAAVGSRSDLGRRCRRLAALHHGPIRRRYIRRRPLRDLRLAIGATRRGYQDREVAKNLGAAAAVRGGAPPAAGTARARPADGR